MILILRNCRSKVWSLVSGEGADELGRVESLNVRGRLLLFEDLPDLVADVVVQQLGPHHRHEHRSHHDRDAHLVIRVILISLLNPFKTGNYLDVLGSS